MLRIDASRARIVAALVLAVALTPSLEAQSLPQAVSSQDERTGPVPVRVRHFEGAVTVQRAHAGETSAALLNLPLDAGDRIWTEADGRVELMLADGTTLWLDRQSTVDVVALAEPGRGEASIVRLWAGSLLAWRPDGELYGELRVDSGDGVVVLATAGTARVDLDEERRLWLSVYEGSASLAAGGIVESLRAGEQTYSEPGTAPAERGTFNTASLDDFGHWQQQRWLAYADTTRHVRGQDYVPDSVRPYAGELAGSGSWFYYDDFGSYAWRPQVSVGWSPYASGRWMYAYSGWTWVPRARWGWVTTHYGRWHHLPAHGWVWFPGAVYRSAWVSWYVGYGYVGWSPIGYYNRPFLSINLWFGGGYGYGRGYHGHYDYRYPAHHYGNRGKAVAGQGYARGDRARPAGWTLVSARDFGAADPVRRAVSRDALPREATRSAATLQGPLRNRNVTALGAGQAGARPAPGRSAVVGSGTNGTRSAMQRPAASGTRNSGAGVGAPGRSVARPSTSGNAGSARPSSGYQSARPRPGTGSGAARPRPGGLSSGLSPRPGTSVSRPSLGGSQLSQPGQATPGRSAVVRPRAPGSPSSGAPRAPQRPSLGGVRSTSPRAPVTTSRPGSTTLRGRSAVPSRGPVIRSRPATPSRIGSPRGVAPGRAPTSVRTPSRGSRPGVSRGAPRVSAPRGTSSRGTSRSRGSARRRSGSRR